MGDDLQPPPTGEAGAELWSKGREERVKADGRWGMAVPLQRWRTGSSVLGVSCWRT